jgi:hypothetical protein
MQMLKKRMCSVCVRASVRACVRVCVCVRVRACVRFAFESGASLFCKALQVKC